jgi:putative membrane protein
MIDWIVRVVINTAAVVVAVQLVPRVNAPDDLVKLLAIGLVLGVVNTYLRPIVKALAFPISLVTLGLVGLLISAGMLLLTAFVAERFDLGLTIAGWPGGDLTLEVVLYAVVAGLVISVVSTILAFFFAGRRLLGVR